MIYNLFIPLALATLTIRAMAPPPKYVKEAEVRNQTQRIVTVTVTFGSAEQEAQGHSMIEDERKVEPGSSATFESRMYDKGTWKVIAPVHSVRAIAPGLDGDDVSHALHMVQPSRLIGRQIFAVVESEGEVGIELGEETK